MIDIGLRKTGIGGSDVASILGVSKWGTPLGVYFAKRGESTPPTEENESMRWGTLLEPVIRQRYSDVTGREVRLPTEMLRHPKHDFMIANIDGCTDDGRLLEVKTARSAAEWGEEGTDEIPLAYNCQVQHYMIVTGLIVADVAVLIGGSDFRIYEVPADPELQDMLIDREAAFWELVKNGTPPEPISYVDAIKRFKTSIAASIQATEAIIDAVRDLRHTREEIDRLKADEEAIKTRLMVEMGENDTLIAPDGSVLCTWKSSKPRETFDAKALQAHSPELYRQFLKTGEPSRRFLLKGESNK